MLIFAAIDSGNVRETKLDEALFLKIADGEKDAFCTLYRQTKSPVFTYALSILHNQSDAEDAMQDTFLKIRAAAHLYHPEGKPLAWILTITRNICLMKLRRQRHVADFPVEDAVLPIDFREIEDTEDRMVLQAAFRVLSEDERQIIFLHTVSGLKQREIAKLMQMPLSTVLSKQRRGLKKLKSELEGSL